MVGHIIGFTVANTLEQKTNLVGFPKAGELIEITGAHELEAQDRAVLNLLYQHAHERPPG